MRLRRVAPLAALGTVLLGLAAPAAGQPRPVLPPAEKRAEPASVRERFGVPAAVKLLGSDDAGERLRGVLRLGAIGTPEAVDALVEQMELGSSLGRDPRARLEAVRALAPFTKKDNVRQLLTREATDTGAGDSRGAQSPLAGVIRGTAALALARGGDKKSLVSLVNALLQNNAVSEAAARALRAAPPPTLDPFLEGRKKLTPALATFLGDAGDLRAIERLRAMLEEPDPAYQVAGIVALARLGDESVLPAARGWLSKTDPRFRKAAAEVLLLLGAPQADAAVTALFSNDATREDGLRLALLVPSPAFAAPLAAELGAFPEALRPRVVAAIGRAGGPKAAEALADLLGKPEHALAAAYALALAPGEAARAALEKGLADPARKGDARRLVLRAAIVRALARGDAPRGLGAALDGALAAEAPADRAVAAFGLVATGALPLADLLERACPPKGCDVALLAAAARGALAGRAEGLDALSAVLTRELGRAQAGDGERSAGERPSLAILAAQVALLARPDGGSLPTSLLATWAESGGPLAPLAARALPSRDDETLRSRIKRLLEGNDPVVRAHVALGLGRDPEPSASRSSARPTASRKTPTCAAPSSARSPTSARRSMSPCSSSPAISTRTTASDRSRGPRSTGAIWSRPRCRRPASARRPRSPGWRWCRTRASPARRVPARPASSARTACRSRW
ncbi:MAG: HEAT repeat domain-containing protein [Byssovorax sp.]